MPTYRQKIAAQEHMSALKAQEQERTARESRRRMSLSACECYCEGSERGLEDARDGYRGAYERLHSLGEDYAWPESYRNGYVAGFGAGE